MADKPHKICISSFTKCSIHSDFNSVQSYQKTQKRHSVGFVCAIRQGQSPRKSPWPVHIYDQGHPSCKTATKECLQSSCNLLILGGRADNENSDLERRKDASGSTGLQRHQWHGLGAWYKTHEAAGFWTKHMTFASINYRELLAVLCAIKSFRTVLKAKNLQILSDNVTTVVYINHLGAHETNDCHLAGGSRDGDKFDSS